MENTAFVEATKIFLTDFCIENNLSQKTVKNKRNFTRRFLIWLGDREFSVDNCRGYIKHITAKGYKPSSIKAEVKNIRSLCSFLYKRKYMADNISQEISIPKVHKEPLKLLSPETAEQVIYEGTKIGPGDRARSIRIKNEVSLALRFILRTGLRVSEAQKLKGTDLNLDDDPPSFYVHSKGGDTELMPLPRDMAQELRGRTERARLFEVTQENLNDVLQRGAKKLGIKQYITVHTLRHVFATSSLKNGTPLQIVSRLLRHDSIAITDSYYSHYDVNDLSLAMNNLPLIKEGLSTDEILQNLVAAINQTGIERDKRFKVNITRDKNELILRVTNNLNE